MTLKQSIQIFARLRPTKRSVTAAYSVDHNEPASLEFVVPRDVTDGFVNHRQENYRFRFQKVFDQDVRQEEIFQHIARPVADSVLEGYNGTIFAYGQTGSGKTFTITGGAERYADRGIIPRTLSYLFQRFSQDSGVVYTTHISYLEIYNEMGYDLLDPRHHASRLEDLPRVLVLEDPDQNIHLRNLSLQLSANEEEALNLLFLGDTNRMIAETPLNQASTRSHCIFTVHVCRREPGSATVRRSKLHLVDLAGSDRVSKTGLHGQLLTEAKFINRSLHYLEQVILALSERNRSHVPYRNSMLTSVLRDSLGGNCTTTMIATLAADHKSLHESISTCRFAQRVALISNEAVLNEELDPALLIARLKREVQILTEELELLRGEQRQELLSPEQVTRLEESVHTFLSDPDPDQVLSPGPDMRKIHFCFSMMKTLILEERRRTGSGCDTGLESSDSRQSSAEVAALKKTLTQRDNEISILVNMLRKEKIRSQEVAALLASDHSPTPQGEAKQNLVSQGVTRESPTPPGAAPQVVPPQSPVNNLEDGSHKISTSTQSSGGQPSLKREEALEMFLKTHRGQESIRDNKNLLKQRASEARKLEDRLKDSREAINELKKRLALQRRQKAAHGVTESPAGDGDGDGAEPLEESLRLHIEREKKAYKDTFGHLKALRMEIEHLQLLLGRTRTRVQQDFQQWWSQQQEVQSEAESARRISPPYPAGSSAGSPVPHGTPPSDPAPLPTPHRASSQGAIKEGAAVPVAGSYNSGGSTPVAGGWRALDPCPTPPPLTGDQQADAHILSFIRARQRLLSKTGDVTDHMTDQKSEDTSVASMTSS